VPGQDADFVVPAGQFDGELDQEAVQLRLGQGVGPLVLDRVLGRGHQDGSGSGRGSPSTDTCRSSIASSSAACVFAGPVDLVGEQEVGETGPSRNWNRAVFAS